MRVVFAVWVIAATVAVAVPALAQDTQPAPPPPRAQKPVTATHYWTLEKMLRRFSRQAGEGRTRL